MTTNTTNQPVTSISVPSVPDLTQSALSQAAAVDPNLLSQAAQSALPQAALPQSALPQSASVDPNSAATQSAQAAASVDPNSAAAQSALPQAAQAASVDPDSAAAADTTTVDDSSTYQDYVQTDEVFDLKSRLTKDQDVFNKKKETILTKLKLTLEKEELRHVESVGKIKNQHQTQLDNLNRKFPQFANL